MKKEIKEVILDMRKRVMYSIEHNEVNVGASNIKKLEKHIIKLEKHKNDLGDLLAKREEQLDKIKDVLESVFVGDNTYLMYNKVENAIKILEETNETN